MAKPPSTPITARYNKMDDEKVLLHNYDMIKDQVATAVHRSLVRIVGGGFALHPNHTANNSNNNSSEILIHHSLSSDNDISWIDQLREIAYTTVSFPNGMNHKNSDNVNGSPSDVDVRAALTLYNRIKKRHYELLLQRGSRNTASSSSSSEMVDQGRHHDNEPKAKKRNVSRNEIEFDIVSDLGTYRKVTSAKSLANLLSVEVEQELRIVEKKKTKSALSLNHDDIITDMDVYDSDMTTTTNDDTSTIEFYDIRPSDSGILCLVSYARSRQLHAAGRVPCTKCIKWCKGMKGLWWHMLREHGVDYSNAMEVAACSVNELAVVKFQESNRMRRVNPMEIGIGKEEPRTLSKDVSNNEADDAFELVKNGKLDALVKLQNASKLLSNHLDKNGANLLHWGAGCGHVHIVSYLIETCNFCPNRGQIGKRSFSGRTPLHWAARNGHLKVVEYLIERCNIDIEAKTLDGTTAFCWAAWQGHLDVMKFLHKHGCDINSLNSFGCNALLWCSQGAATPKIFSWLYSSGADFTLVNDNGHSALHKAAQRGNTSACKWLVDTFLLNQNGEFDGFLLIGPDAEGACPSDLCGMNGHDNLAEWLSKQECDYVRRYSNHMYSRAVNAHEAYPDDKQMLPESGNIPSWFGQTTNGNGGINRMKSALTDCFCEVNPMSNDFIECRKSQLQREQLSNLSEID